MADIQQGERRFPILRMPSESGPRSIPWSLIEPLEDRARARGWDLPLAELANLGGLSLHSLVSLLLDRSEHALGPDHARDERLLGALLESHSLGDGIVDRALKLTAASFAKRDPRISYSAAELEELSSKIAVFLRQLPPSMPVQQARSWLAEAAHHRMIREARHGR